MTTARSLLAPIEVTWLLKNPFGASPEPGQRGDFVRVSDDRATIYLLPNEFDHADERRLRWLLAQQPTRASRRTPRRPTRIGQPIEQAPVQARSSAG